MKKLCEALLPSGQPHDGFPGWMPPWIARNSSSKQVIVEGMMQSIFLQPDGNRYFWANETRSYFAYDAIWGWSLVWAGNLTPGYWNGPGPTGRSLTEFLILGLELPYNMPPEKFKPKGHYEIGPGHGRNPFHASYGIAHDLSEYGVTRYLRFDVEKGSLDVSRTNNDELLGQFELTIPLVPSPPAPFEPVGTPDYEPPEFNLLTQRGTFVFPPAPIPIL